jgi:uncharacterized membrane protein HdeD (DUF308 family)
MATAERPTLLRHLWKSTLASGVVAVIVGVLVLVWPGISILVTAILFGAYLLISGFTQVFSAFTQPSRGLAGCCCSSAVPRH